MTLMFITRKGKEAIKEKDPSAKIRRGWSFPCPKCTDFDLPSANGPIIIMDKISPCPSHGYIAEGFIEGTCKVCGTTLRVKEDQ